MLWDNGDYKMIRLLEPYFYFPDSRGTITGVVQEGNWKEINIINSKKGSRRGDHYHKLSNELFIILKGKVKVHLYMIGNREYRSTIVVTPRDAFIVPPCVHHTFEILEESTWINALDRIEKDDFYKTS